MVSFEIAHNFMARMQLFLKYHAHKIQIDHFFWEGGGGEEALEIVAKINWIF